MRIRSVMVLAAAMALLANVGCASRSDVIQLEVQLAVTQRSLDQALAGLESGLDVVAQQVQTLEQRAARMQGDIDELIDAKQGLNRIIAQMRGELEELRQDRTRGVNTGP